jgi:hypothetical protein
MSKFDALFIVFAVIISLIIAYYQYLYNNKSKNKGAYLLSFLRFLAVFLLLLLLINPKIKRQIISTIKPNLVVLYDNSASIKYLKQNKVIEGKLEAIKKNESLQSKFEVDYFSFGNDINSHDSLKFDDSSTNIYKTLSSVNKLYNKTIAPIIVITDGNQTLGNSIDNLQSKQAIYPLIVGDTTRFKDIKIVQLNVNKYAYLKHKFPVETFIVVEGIQNDIKAKFTVKEGNQTVFSKNINLNAKANSKQISFYLPTLNVGMHNYKASISYLENEKNRINNRANFTVEVIDEQSKILIVTDILHPDISMLKRAVESNKQRKLIIKKPSNSFSINKYQLVICYQPNASFDKLFKELESQHKNFLIFTGTNTDWNFLNKAQSYFKKNAIQKTENYLAEINPSYSTFLIEDLNFDNFSPVKDYFGDLTFSVPNETLLFQQINGFSTKQPLLSTFEINNRRGAVFFGENSWQWRMTSKNDNKTYQNFDTFINKLIQYLSSSKRSNLLESQNKSLYYSNEKIKIKVQYYDANFEFDNTAKLWVSLTNKTTRKQLKYPLALINNSYEVNISDLKSGHYYYKIYDETQKNTANGHFSVLDYNMEQQFVGANYQSLQKVAKNSNGELFFANQSSDLISQILNNTQYKSIQKSTEKTSPLIDWKWLLGLIILALSLELFIRKYKGYI